MQTNEKYMYCIIRKPRFFDLDFDGVGGGKIHLISHGKLAIVASDSVMDDYPITRENTVAHQEVIEEIMQGYSPVLPISFGTIAEDGALIQEKILRAKQDELLNALQEIEGKIELNLKAIWLDMPAIFKKVATENSELCQMKKFFNGKIVGRDEAIEIGKLVADGISARKKQIRDEILAMLEDVIVDHKDIQLLGDQMIFNLAVLIPEDKQESFDSIVRNLDEKYREENAYFKYIGPTPPFNFVKVQISLN